MPGLSIQDRKEVLDSRWPHEVLEHLARFV